MINVCHNCGEYRADKTIDLGGPYAICPVCGYKHPFIQAPLLLVGGASGAGKSTLCQALAGKINEVVLLDGDILWRAEFASPEDNFRGFFETWLRLGKNISQSGRPVVLFLAGAIPENVEPCVERRYFSQVHYLALVCDEEVLAERLRRRPRWRESGMVQVLHAFGPGVAPQTVELFQLEERVIRIGQPPFTVERFAPDDRFIHLGVPPTQLEIMTSISAVTFEACYLEQAKAIIDEVPVQVIGLTQLKLNKQASIRPKDADDLAHLS